MKTNTYIIYKTFDRYVLKYDKRFKSVTEGGHVNYFIYRIIVQLDILTDL